MGVHGRGAAGLVGGYGMSDRLFEKIVEEHYTEIHRYLRSIVSREVGTDELCQRTFVQAFRAHRSLPTDANVRAWLFTIASQLCRNHLRTIGPRAVRQAPSPNPPTADRGSAQIEGLAGARLGAAIRSLPVVEALAFTMRKLHGLDYEAIGASLDCSAESARSHVLEAMRKIRCGLTARTSPRRSGAFQNRRGARGAVRPRGAIPARPRRRAPIPAKPGSQAERTDRSDDDGLLLTRVPATER
jgi:RNA polymerase sigma-70 factor, ECF subfamily